MTEPQDVLVEALRPLLAWAEAVSQHHAMLRTEPPFTTTQALKEALASAYAALVRTPETLDVAGLRREIEALPNSWHAHDIEVAGHVSRAAVLAIVDRLALRDTPVADTAGIDAERLAEALMVPPTKDWIVHPQTAAMLAPIIAREYDRLAATPAPDPGAGLREALLGLRGVIGENCWCWQVQADRTQHEDTCLAAQAALVLERTP